MVGGIPRSVRDCTVLRNVASRSGTMAAVFATSVQLSHGREKKGLARLLYVLVDIKDDWPRDQCSSCVLLSSKCTQEYVAYFCVSENGTIF